MNGPDEVEGYRGVRMVKKERAGGSGVSVAQSPPPNSAGRGLLNHVWRIHQASLRWRWVALRWRSPGSGNGVFSMNFAVSDCSPRANGGVSPCWLRETAG